MARKWCKPCTVQATERHEQTGDNGYDAECAICVQSKDPNRRHKRSKEKKRNCGTIAADIAVHTREGPCVLVMTTHERGGRHILHAQKLADKTAEEIPESILPGIMEVEYVYNIGPLVRLHPD